MSGEERFKLKKGASGAQAFSLFFLGLLAVGGVILAFVFFGSGDSTGGVIMLAVGLIMAGVAYYMVRKGGGPGGFVALTAEGINISGKAMIRWDAIDSVQEEDWEQDLRYVSVKKKRLRIRYADQAAGTMKEDIRIHSDFEGYPFIRERIMRVVRERQES